MSQQAGISFKEFRQRFQTEEACEGFLFEQRWPDGFVCPKCGGYGCYRLRGRREYVCRQCRRQSSVTAGTVLHGVVRGKHILVVDDIEVNRIILVKILSTLGAACDTACNGREAVDKFEASQPGDYDLILMDVQMPVLDSRSKQLEEPEKA